MLRDLTAEEIAELLAMHRRMEEIMDELEIRMLRQGILPMERMLQ